ncbi:chlorinating enzyme [Aquimarina agarivorans]|uniref:chlorinating enzyme n=1 Tax=Aquimarina agarivorans TaxID=980584 RepID=UPI000248FD12|nr:chlorinating enzyme [Aquimarina agarivorans]
MNLDHLNAKEIKAIFDKDGVVGPFRAYDPDIAKTMLKNIRSKSMIQNHAIHKNNVGWDRHFDVQDLSDHISNVKILEKVKVILGEDILCWRTEFFPKFPKSAGTDWHQVGTFQYVTGDPILQPTISGKDEYVEITAWTAFTDATIENGCMKFLPGTHKKQYYNEGLPVTGGRDTEYTPIEKDNFYGYDFEEFKIDPKWDPDEMESKSIEMKAGEFILFTSKCIHGSHPNVSERSTRFAFSSRFVPTQVKVYPNHDEFHGHGGFFQLKKSGYGCVLVSGEDTFKHNQIRTENSLGTPFQKI